MDDPEKFRVGDVVRVKNIVGPRMLLTGFDPKQDGLVCLKWFDRRFELQSEWLHLRHLAKFNPSKDRPMGFRAALMEIRDRCNFDHNYDLRVGGVLLREFIDNVLASGFGAAIDPVIPQEEPEMADAAD